MAKKFTNRYTKPTASNLEYVRTARGGWSRCCQGSPTDAACDTLANCVGFACGRFNEIYNEIMGTTGMKYYGLNCNAENFIERAKEMYPELQFSDTPAVGAIICWARGKVGVGDDGAGHVAVVEEVLDANTIKTSESAYGGTAFYVSTRKNDNGRWGIGSAYTFRAFILNPAVDSRLPIPSGRDTMKDQLEITSSGQLYVRTAPGLSATKLGLGSKGFYNILDKDVADGYNWYKIGEDAWSAEVKATSVFHPAIAPWVEPQPVEKDETKDQVFVGKVNVRIRAEASTSSSQMGLLSSPEKYYEVLEMCIKPDYTWYKIGENSWVAGVINVIFHKAKTETDDVFGIDISEWQEGLNIAKVKEEGVKFAILRAGFTGSSDGKSKAKDACFETFYTQCKANDIKVGAYWFSRATSYEAGAEEAQYMIDNCLMGKQFEYPIAIDVEDPIYQQSAGKKAVAEAILGFCETMEKNNYYPMVYSNINWLKNYIDASKIKSVAKWVAYWGTEKPDNYNPEVWQYGGSTNLIRDSKIAGMVVDQDYSYVDYDKKIVEKKLNGFDKDPEKELKIKELKLKIAELNEQIKKYEAMIEDLTK